MIHFWFLMFIGLPWSETGPLECAGVPPSLESRNDENSTSWAVEGVDDTRRQPLRREYAVCIVEACTRCLSTTTLFQQSARRNSAKSPKPVTTAPQGSWQASTWTIIRLPSFGSLYVMTRVGNNAEWESSIAGQIVDSQGTKHRDGPSSGLSFCTSWVSPTPRTSPKRTVLQ